MLILPGNTKYKMGFNREPGPFTFMKEWVDFISSKGDQEFKKLVPFFKFVQAVHPHCFIVNRYIHRILFENLIY